MQRLFLVDRFLGGRVGDNRKISINKPVLSGQDLSSLGGRMSMRKGRRKDMAERPVIMGRYWNRAIARHFQD